MVVLLYTLNNGSFALYTEQVYKDGKLRIKSFSDSCFPTATGFQFLLTAKEPTVKSSATFLSLIKEKKVNQTLLQDFS